MPRGRPMSLSARITETARDALKILPGLEAVSEWEKEYGAFTQRELNEARRRERSGWVGLSKWHWASARKLNDGPLVRPTNR